MSVYTLCENCEKIHHNTKDLSFCVKCGMSEHLVERSTEQDQADYEDWAELQAEKAYYGEL